ncbi:MAG TPA: arginine--tRNA ligase [Acidimicrobiales bacterium]|nr:arginine--tRNA ligase [Acidimicrobiales bacterium]
MTVRDVLADSVLAALADLEVEPLPPAVALERPARPEHGDWSTNVALTSAKAAGRSPRDLAAALAEFLSAHPPPHVASVEVAGPGFVHFRLRDSWLHDALRQIVREGTDGFARHDVGNGERVQVEFVSANPTGPLHVGNGWLCSYGDSLARLLARCGWSVSREYYVNDTGGQIRRLGESMLARRSGAAVPEEGYQGEYVSELARAYDGPDDVVAAGVWASARILDNIRSTLQGLGIVFDEWFSQASIEESGAVEQTISLLTERDMVYQSEGATWLRSTNFGDSRDRVLVKSDGEFTYLAGDLAYHRDKFLVRDYDRVIDIFGADHHGQVASLRAGVQALGVEPGRLEVELGQLVSLADGKMSKRAGNFVSMDELVADIGPDATRLLSLMNSIDQATTLDLELVRRQSMENPVYYVQYAHARIASIDRVRRERGIERRPIDGVQLELLAHQRELALLRSLTELPDVVLIACGERAPHKVTTWVRQLAGDFHGFYHDCYVMGQGISEDLTQARLWLVEGARIGLAVGLGLLGVSAPESM